MWHVDSCCLLALRAPGSVSKGSRWNPCNGLLLLLFWYCPLLQNCYNNIDDDGDGQTDKDDPDCWKCGDGVIDPDEQCEWVSSLNEHAAHVLL